MRKEHNLNTSLLKPQQSFSGNLSIWIECTDKHPFDLVLLYELGATFKWLAANRRRAGFKRGVKGRLREL